MQILVLGTIITLPMEKTVHYHIWYYLFLKIQTTSWRCCYNNNNKKYKRLAPKKVSIHFYRGAGRMAKHLRVTAPVVAPQ